MMARSPSCRFGESEKLAVNVESTAAVDPLKRVIERGLIVPVSVSITGRGSPAPIDIWLPSKDSPSGFGEKYDGPSTWDVPSVNNTVKLSDENCTNEVTGQVASPEEFGPV
jgi:hypothetical protein